MKDLDTGFFKIGVSDNPYRRVTEITSPIHVVILIHFSEGDEALEAKLHDAMNEFCVGGEWFDFTDEALARLLTQFMPPISEGRSDMNVMVEEFNQNSNGWEINLQ